jgi:hypothetical protein
MKVKTMIKNIFLVVSLICSNSFAFQDMRPAPPPATAADFPFYAVLSCVDEYGTLYPVTTCFGRFGSPSETSLVIMNGGDNNKYTGGELNNLPNRSIRGRFKDLTFNPHPNGVAIGSLTIDLRERFELSMQNGAPQQRMNLKIHHRASNKMVFEKTAVNREFIRISN